MYPFRARTLKRSSENLIPILPLSRFAISLSMATII